LEEKAGEAYPVEYKRGGAPRDENERPTVWDNDAVQVCAQAMLLEEELKRPISRGVLYYIGTRDRVNVELNEGLREQTKAAIGRVRELNVLPAPPPPLPAGLRHRCEGCSLVTVCQPEETLYEIRRAERPDESAAVGLMRVLPGTEAGAVLYLQEP